MQVPPDPEDYRYTYPEKAIAQSPAYPRDSAKLLVYDRKSKRANISTFAHIAEFLPPQAVLVVNQTKVVPARFYAVKPTGGRVELLYVGKQAKTFDALANRALNLGDVLTFGEHTLKVVKKLDKGYRFAANFALSRLFPLLEKHGITPTPPYIKHISLSERRLREEYQTVFAKTAGSSAAPTASLHFTKRLLSKLQKQGIALEYVTLHVGLGTFAPLTEAQLHSGKLHKEWYEIPAATAKRLKEYKSQGRPIIAVGTTVVRTLESAVGSAGKLQRLTGTTDLFIYPPYSFKFVDGLITNFHVPKSSLMMLVASLVGKETLLQLYKKAITKGFRLFSFGDGMLIK